MPDQVKVEDLEVFGQFRAAMIKFAQAADSALTNAETEISRTRTWLEGEQRNYWEGQLRRRLEAVTKAREAVRQKKLYRDVSGRTPSAVEEEKALRRCLLAAEEAQQKIDAVRKWVPRLEREANFYRGGVARLSHTIIDDVPRAVALLDRLATTLEQYVQLEAPAAPASESAPATTAQEPISRGGDVLPAATPAAAAAPPAGTDPPAAQPPAPAEDSHVSSGR